MRKLFFTNHLEVLIILTRLVVFLLGKAAVWPIGTVAVVIVVLALNVGAI